MQEYNRAKIKEEAKAIINKNVFNLLIGNLIVIAITMGIGYIPLAGLIAFVLNFGLSLFYINFLDKRNIDYMDIFCTFKLNDFNLFFTHLLTAIIKQIFVFLWSLLLIIPGIIKGISYSQVNYIRVENPDMGIMECIKESERIMQGHKWDYFVLQLSFLGWHILCVLTFGLLYIYVLPYFTMTKTLFYRQINPKYKVENI